MSLDKGCALVFAKTGCNTCDMMNMSSFTMDQIANGDENMSKAFLKEMGWGK